MNLVIRLDAAKGMTC